MNNNQQGMKFRLGIFVLGAAILLAILIILFGEFPMLFTRQVHYRVTFDQAPGVEQGTPVRKSGVKIGEVMDFDLDPDTGKVTVQIAVERKYQLRKGDQAVLSRGLLGETAINFVPDGDRAPAPEGHTFAGKAPTDVPQALGKMSEKASDLAVALEATLTEIRTATETFNKHFPEFRQTNAEVRAAAERFGKASERVEVLIEGNEQRVTKALDRFTEAASRAADALNEENQKNLSAALKNIRTASDNFEKLVKDSDLLIEETRKTVKTVGDRIDSIGQSTSELITESRTTVKRINESLNRSDEVLNNLQQATKPMAERSATVMKNLEESTARFNQIAVDVRDFTKTLAEPEGTLRRFVSDPALYNRLNETAVTLNRAACRLDRILQDIQVFADKIARHPELLGIGGAVNPSQGLK